MFCNMRENRVSEVRFSYTNENKKHPDGCFKTGIPKKRKVFWERGGTALQVKTFTKKKSKQAGACLDDGRGRETRMAPPSCA